MVDFSFVVLRFHHDQKWNMDYSNERCLARDIRVRLGKFETHLKIGFALPSRLPINSLYMKNFSIDIAIPHFV